MATATILCTQTSFGIGGYGSSDETTVLVGKADGYTENARVRFPALNPAWVIKSIKFQFRRNDGDATRVLRFGTNQSASFDSRNTLDWKKNFSVSSGYAFKTFDFTPNKAIIQGYSGNWYVHITHGSGDRSYCTFNGGGSSNRPRIVVEYEDASVVLPDDTFIIGEESTFTVGVADSGLTHKLYYSAGSASGQIVVGEVDEFDGGAEISWTPSAELAYEVVDTDVGTITITVETYEGTTLRSSVPFEFNLAVPADMVPVIDDVTISLVNPSGDTVGEYVQGRSRARAVIEARSVYGAEIVSYQMAIDGTSYDASEPEVLSAVLNVPGTKTVTITVTDTRGRTATETLTNAITVYPYTPPVVASLKLERALNDPPDYTPSNSGQYIKFTLSCVFSPINGKNIKTGSIRFRASDGEWSEAFSLNDGMDAWGSTYSFPLQGLLGDNDIGSGSYVVEVTLTDRYNTVTQEAGLSSRLIWIDRHGSGEGVAIGGEAVTPSLFDVYIPARFRGSVKFDNPAAALANLAPFCILTQPVSETFSYNATLRWWTFNWREIDTNGDFQFKQGGALPTTEWSSSTAYSVGDKVAHEGSSYSCIQAHTNQEPPNATYWSDDTRNIGVIVPEDGVYYAALSVRFTTANAESGFWMRIAVFPEDTVFPARNYFLDSDGISSREMITQVIPAWSKTNTIGNAVGAIRCYADDIILPYGYLNSASKQLSSSDTRFGVWKIG